MKPLALVEAARPLVRGALRDRWRREHDRTLLRPPPGAERDRAPDGGLADRQAAARDDLARRLQLDDALAHIAEPGRRLGD